VEALMGPILMHTPHRAINTEKKSLSPSVNWNGTPTPSEVFVLEGAGTRENLLLPVTKATRPDMVVTEPYLKPTGWAGFQTVSYFIKGWH